MKIRIALTLIGFFGMNAFCQTVTNEIKVQGNAIIYEIPELMVVNISIREKDSIYSGCSDKLTAKYNLMEKVFMNNEISKNRLKANELNINKNYFWFEGKRKYDGYVGQISAILELPFSPKSLNIIMDTLGGNDVSVDYKLSFKLSQNQKERLLKKSIELAIEDAKTKAKYIANSLNVTLTQIKDVNFGYTSYIDDLLINETDISYDKVAEDMVAEQTLNLNPQKIEIKKTLGIIWSIKQ